jgi:uncharacterized membrane protein YcfT
MVLSLLHMSIFHEVMSGLFLVSCILFIVGVYMEHRLYKHILSKFNGAL